MEPVFSEAGAGHFVALCIRPLEEIFKRIADGCNRANGNAPTPLILMQFPVDTLNKFKVTTVPNFAPTETPQSTHTYEAVRALAGLESNFGEQNDMEPNKGFIARLKTNTLSYQTERSTILNSCLNLLWGLFAE